MIRALAGLLVAAGLLAPAGCSWHRAGQADAVLPGEALAAPAPGMGIAEALAFAGTRESGDFTVRSELQRISAVRGGIWEDVSARDVTRGRLAPEPGTDYVVVVRRECSDWEGRERWSDARASWFLLPGGRLAAWDHWSFGPRCAVGNRFRPLAGDSPSRESERDLLRWLEQRLPPGPLPLELRFERGRAYAETGRLDEARSLLRFGDDGLQGREDLFEKRRVAPEEAAAFEAEGRRLRGLRAELREAIRKAEQQAAAAAAP